jgi:hypothetical protein
MDQTSVMIRNMSNDELKGLVEQVFARNLNSGKFDSDTLLQDLCLNKDIPLASYEQMMLAEFIWRGMSLDQQQILSLLAHDLGTESHEDAVLSVRERN